MTDDKSPQLSDPPPHSLNIYFKWLQRLKETIHKRHHNKDSCIQEALNCKGFQSWDSLFLCCWSELNWIIIKQAFPSPKTTSEKPYFCLRMASSISSGEWPFLLPFVVLHLSPTTSPLNKAQCEWKLHSCFWSLSLCPLLVSQGWALCHKLGTSWANDRSPPSWPQLEKGGIDPTQTEPISPSLLLTLEIRGLELPALVSANVQRTNQKEGI